MRHTKHKRGQSMTKKTKQFVVSGAILLCAAIVLQICARSISDFATWYAHHIYPVLVGIIGRFFGIFPFSVVEIGLYLLIIWLIVYFIRFLKEPIRLITRTFFLVALLFFLYTINCGINYYSVSFSSYAGLETNLYTSEELLELCGYLVEKVNETATSESYSQNKGEWRKEGVRAMQQAAREFPSLQGYYPHPKQVTVSYILSVQQLCGIYVPFTIEANFNGAMPNYNIPHTICHELSHLSGFMREDEANFIGYLACIRSDNQAFSYSGYLTGWVYAGNELAKVDMESYIALHEQLCEQAQTDLRENNIFWNRYEGKVAEVSNQWNDTYLKMNDQTEGIRSYGRMVDLMLAYHKTLPY